MYQAQIDDCLNCGYAVPASTAPKTGPQWFLPHHPVSHPSKPGKVRVVFDGAAKWKGSSLNDHLLPGPDLTNNLVGVLVRFRQHKGALAADIAAMFHQVKVADEDLGALRFLWRPGGDMNQDPEEYCMTRHIFGLTSSPSCATYALRKTSRTAIDF
jgi:hypothetical protein